MAHSPAVTQTSDLNGASGPARRRRPSGGPPSWRRWISRFLAPVFILVAAVIMARGMKQLDWDDIQRAIEAYPWTTIFTACGFSLVAFAISSTYDLLGRHYERHSVSRARALATGFVAYAFTMNLGSLVGGWGMRYRLYSHYGLPVAQVTRIICLALMTNWAGFVLLAGLVFAFHPPQLPQSWPVHAFTLHAIGALLLAGVAAYLTLCARGGDWRIRGVKMRRPSLPFAGLQLLLSCGNWLMMGLVLNHLLPAQVHYLDILGVLFVSAIAGLIVRVPAGLGVLETVFLAILGAQAGKGPLFAGLLAFRVAYYLVPLAAGLVIYGVLELQARRRTQKLTGSTRIKEDS